jgi:uncharacterized protein
MLRDHLRGHLLLFDQRSHPLPSAAAIRLLMIFGLLEVMIGPRMRILGSFDVPIPSWIRIGVLLVLALLLVRFVAGIRLSDIGLVPWRDWTTTERSYFIQAFVLGNTVFGFVFASRLRAIARDEALWTVATGIVLTQFAWGFYQELVYRGILQTALVARWGAVAAILIANTLYSFGPLHWYHFARSSPWPMLAGIFAIGLFFSLVFWRSGNLWMVGLFHGLGDFWVTGTQQILG